MERNNKQHKKAQPAFRSNAVARLQCQPCKTA